MIRLEEFIPLGVEEKVDFAKMLKALSISKGSLHNYLYGFKKTPNKAMLKVFY